MYPPSPTTTTNPVLMHGMYNVVMLCLINCYEQLKDGHLPNIHHNVPPPTHTHPHPLQHVIHTVIPLGQPFRAGEQAVVKHSLLHKVPPCVWRTLYTPLYQPWNVQGQYSYQTFPATQKYPQVCDAHCTHLYTSLEMYKDSTVIKHSRLHKNTRRCVTHTVHTFIPALKCRGTVIKHSLLHKAPTFMSTMTGRKKDSTIIKHSMKHKAPLCIWLALYTAPCQPVWAKMQYWTCFQNLFIEKAHLRRNDCQQQSTP